MGISVFVIDQERTFADALATRLEAEENVAVAIAVHRHAPPASVIARRHADVVVLDGDLPGDAAIRLCRELTLRGGTPRIVLLSSGTEPARIAAAVRAGMAGWVSKSESLEHLLHVIRGVAAGETYLPPAAAGQVLRLLLQEGRRQRESDRLLAALTPREREILSYLADGTGRQDVANRMHLSANTVRTHLQNLMTKLGVHSTLEAVAVTRPGTRRAGPGRRGAIRRIGEG
jgi:DNA-binding NarL/FixJ family response regulator